MNDEAKKAFNTIIVSGDWKKAERARGIFSSQGMYIAFDNTTGECWQEEFTLNVKALNWLNASCTA